MELPFFFAFDTPRRADVEGWATRFPHHAPLATQQASSWPYVGVGWCDVPLRTPDSAPSWCPVGEHAQLLPMDGAKWGMVG